ncbi:MAG: trypsin-like serine protease [Jatrophihabitans sp.]|nr:MAG: trypsin-like serine protease [Jatrophihabitans sp.]
MTDTDATGLPAAVDDPAAYRRPAGVDGAFEPREQEPPRYTPPPPTASPQDRARFARPPGAGGYPPPPGERVGPAPMYRPPVPAVMRDAFGAPARARDGFDPEPGTRIAPRHPAESPWWRAGAHRDPWRDPSSPYWLGRGAVFTRGRPAQLDPDLDTESDAESDTDGPDDPARQDAPEEVLDEPRRARVARLGLSRLSLVVLVTLLAGVVGGGVGYWLAGRANGLLHRSDVTLATTGTPANRPPGSVADIARRVGPAVVSIAVTTSSTYAVGSGVVVDKNGYVLTNNHVVSQAAAGTDASIVVTFSDEATAPARIVGTDPISDLAVLKVPTDQLTVASLGDSSQLAVGDPVIAIGSPLGLDGTVTSGIVSALNRAVHVFSEDGQSDAYLDAIQTDAAINPGNSGGALVDAAGAVVGINTAGRFLAPSASGQQTPVSGIGYAIPIDYARRIAEQLIRTGTATHGSLQAQGRTVTDGSQQGAYLEQVIPGGAADRAGLRNGDVIVVADGRPVLTFDQLMVLVQQHQPGDTMDVMYFRGADKRTASITLGSR